MMELPSISKSNYGSSSSVFLGHAGEFQARDPMPGELERRLANNILRQAGQMNQLNAQGVFLKEKQMPSARIVRVFIADPNENLPLDKRVIFKSEEKLTDLTDQELFFDANPSALLAKHNEYRTTVVDKTMTQARNKDTFLEPARIRDLKMVVVDVAAF